MMRNELRYAIRSLWRDRAFALMVVLSLAVGIGANTAIFSMVNGVLLRKPAYQDPDRLVSISVSSPRFAGYPSLPINLAMLMEWRKQCTSFEGITAVQPVNFNLTGVGEPERLAGAAVAANTFTVLGVLPRIGRNFEEHEDLKGQHMVVILTDSLWQRRFHADPAIIGSKIMVGSPGTELEFAL